MILRRLATALRKQDWFTVAIETLIVVLGVFLGIQLGNWNSARLAEAEADDLVKRMLVEADGARADMADYIAIHADILDRALKFSVRLQDAETCLDAGDEMTQLVLGVGDFPPPRFSLPTASEAIESGGLSRIGSDEIRDEVRRIIDEMTFIDRQWQRYVRVKQDAERAIYTAAGTSLVSDAMLDVRPGIEWDGIDQYRLLTLEGVCGNTEMIAFAFNAALTQHIYSVYIGEVSDKLDAYAAGLSAYAGERPAPVAAEAP